VPRLLSWALLLLAACGAEPEPSPGLPSSLPFELIRPDAGEPLTAAELGAFTAELEQFWERTNYFAWADTVSHGVHASTGKADFSIWWHDVVAQKSGDTVTFVHGDTGGGHNVYIPTSTLLAAAAAGYLVTGDAAMGKLVQGYGKGLGAACRGLVHDPADPEKFLMARNVVAQSHQYPLADGRLKAVDFSGWYSPYQEWNAQRFEYRDNPFWGPVWVTNMRSKDDVPHIFLAELMLRYVIERGADPEVVAGAKEGDECVTGFARDIVMSGFLIRTKDATGVPFVPSEDLASFVQYDSLIPNAECNAKLTSALIGTGDAAGLDCGLGDRNDYEAIATSVHYYNYHIVQTFHVAAALAALMHRQDQAARALLNGLILRADRYADPASGEPGLEDNRWDADRARFLLQAGAAGLPLTSQEARHVQVQISAAIRAYQDFANWNLWDAPDGTYPPRGGFLPDDQGRLVRPEELGLAALYCGSPFRNQTGVAPVDCAALLSR
jgi:hypothetical protein